MNVDASVNINPQVLSQSNAVGDVKTPEKVSAKKDGTDDKKEEYIAAVYSEKRAVKGASGEEALTKAIEQANKKLSAANREFEFSIHAKTKSIVIKVKDRESSEVIREIPSEDILDMVAKMCEMAGILVDEKR